MKKTLLYFGIAVILGLLLALVPLITLAEFRAENHFDTLLCERSLSEKMNNLMEAYGLSEPVYSIANFEALGVCFAIALVVYLLFRRRI